MNFCVLIHGSDELYAMPDEDTAERCAKAHSEMMKPWLAKEKAEGRMLWVTEQMVSGEAIEWPHSEAAFSEALKEFSLKDWGLDCTQPAQIPEHEHQPTTPEDIERCD